MSVRSMGRAFRGLIPEGEVVSDPRARERVRRALVEHYARMLRVVQVLSPPTVALFAALLLACGSRPLGVAAWVGLTLLTTTGPMWCATRTMPEDHERWVRTTSITLVPNGVAWGSFTVFALPPEPEQQAIVGVLILGVLAANSNFGATVPTSFWSFQLAVAGSTALGLLVHRPEVTLLVLAVLAYAVPFSGLLARISRVAQTNAAHYAASSDDQRAAVEVANRELAHRASHDGLTGLRNRQSFTALVGAALAAPGRRGRVGLLFIDLDRFKVINDSLGHAVGDEVLKAVAARIGGTCRPGEALGRMGGDELTMLLPEVADVDAALARSEEVLAALAPPIAIGSRQVGVGASIGVACSDDDVDTATDLLRLADAALYRAKASGRGTAQGFDSALRVALDRRLDEEVALRRALDEGDVVAWFQPVIELATLRVNGAEALARWDHATGVRPAATFIDLAIDTGLDVEVSRAVARDVLALRGRLAAAGHTANLGLNVPPSRLDAVGEMLAPLDRLDGIAVEITETGVIHDPASAHDALQGLRDRGATVWLDDFGRGDSALALLVDLPLDGVKIDRGFTARMLTDPTTRAIVEAISRLTQELGLWVVAEGVETEEQLDFVRRLGIPWAQGYLLGRPQPADDMVALLERDRAGVVAPS